jgi:hypothetical protein
MFDSVNQRFVTAIIFLASYGVLETQFQLGIIASAALSSVLFWRCSKVVCVAILIADIALFYYANKDYCHIPFLLSETLLLYYRPALQVRPLFLLCLQCGMYNQAFLIYRHNSIFLLLNCDCNSSIRATLP